jgi:chemotaxis protein histidine kinase CheA
VIADHTLLAVFIDDALRYLTLVEDEEASDAERNALVHDLERALELLGSDADAERARRVVATLRRDPVVGAAALADLTRELKRRLAEATAAPPIRSGALPADDPEAHADDAWSSSEYALLRNLFRDEAHGVLDGVTRRLLDGSPAEFGDALFDEVMRATHSLKGSAGTVGLTDFADAAHRLEDAFDRLRRGSMEWSAAVSDDLVDTIDAMREYLDGLNENGRPDAQTVDRMRAQTERLALGGRADRADEGSGVTVKPRRRSAPSEPPPDDLTREERRNNDRRRDELPMLRVDPARIDRLMDSVGELVFDRTRIERRVRELAALGEELTRTRRELHDEVARVGDEGTAGEPDALAQRLGSLEADLAQQVSVIRRATSALMEDVEALRRTGIALQDGLTSVRMQTVRTLFQMLAPQLRSIARAAGKRVKLFTAGAETEFDKAVAEQITDPLIQLLRNALAHGIEPPELRVARGKPAEGQITIAARHEGSVVAIEVSDDGAGIDPDRLRQRLVDSGRWSGGRAKLAADDEVLRAIFEAGVSSRDQADQLAGRGFGLDAVRETAARLGGEIRVRSARGRGTTFTLRLPLTTAISNALLFKVGGHVYAVPNVHVVETVQVEPSSPAIPSHLKVGEQPVPLVLLHGVLGSNLPRDIRLVPAVVIEYLGKRLAVTCDKIIGPREIVLKGLGPLLAPLPLYAGGTISGSGKVQLILDPAALVQIAFAEDEAAGIEEEPDTTIPTAPLLSGRVLVADDSLAIREAMTRILERAGYIVDVAEDGSAAWQMLQRLRYDVLVTDLEMPQLDGFALIERLRGDRELGSIPVIVISSRTTQSNKDRASALGVASFLAKPVTQKVLVSALERLR